LQGFPEVNENLSVQDQIDKGREEAESKSILPPETAKIFANMLRDQLLVGSYTISIFYYVYRVDAAV